MFKFKLKVLWSHPENKEVYPFTYLNPIFLSTCTIYIFPVLALVHELVEKCLNANDNLSSTGEEMEEEEVFPITDIATRHTIHI